MELTFERNVGDVDRAIRIGIGTALTLLGISSSISGALVSMLVSLLGLSQIVEGIVGY